MTDLQDMLNIVESGVNRDTSTAIDDRGVGFIAGRYPKAGFLRRIQGAYKCYGVSSTTA